MVADKEFNEHGRRMSEVFAPMTDADVTGLVKNVVDTPPEAVAYLSGLLRKQGISAH
jgi:hypothetical protein